VDIKAGGLRGGNNEEGDVFCGSPEGLRDNSDGSVLSDLLKDVPHLMSEELKEIVKFFVDLKVIHELKLVPDNVFLVRLLLKVRRSLLTFYGECIGHGGLGSNVKLVC
jgi:hypothetical protein